MKFKWILMTGIICFLVFCQISAFTVRHAMVHKHYGRALKLLQKHLEEKPTKEQDKTFIEVSHGIVLLAIVHP